MEGTAMKKLAFLISGLLLTLNYSFSQTHIPAGNVSGTWTAASSPYIIEGDINIAHDMTLTIEPGVEVWFSHLLLEVYELNVYGRLIAEGTEADSIFFFAVDTTNRWNGIDFHKLDTNSMDSSRVRYCHFEYANGAIWCDSSSKVNISNTLFINNRGSWGGGINCNYSSPRIDQVIIKNSIVDFAGGMYLHHNSNPYISNSTINNNYSGNDGGGIYLEANSNPILINVDISYNIAGSKGGGILSYFFNNPQFSEVVIRHNSAVDAGGGIYTYWGSTQVLSNVVIRNNYADKGGGIYLYHGAANIDYFIIYENIAERGGGIYCYASDPDLDHLTIYNNTGFTDGGGIYTYSDADPDLNNSILWNNSPQSYSTGEPSTCSLTATWSDIEGGTGQPWFGTGCRDTDPEFTNPVLWDYSLSWPGFPYAPRSPCINHGDPSSPLDPDGSRSDMGAIPYTISEGTYINGGDYCGTWNLSNSPFIVEGTVNVPVDCELTIQHGVEVIFWYRYPFNVYGRLLAEGTSWDKITFTQAESRWKGIKFYNTNTNGQDSSLIKHAIIKYVFYADVQVSGGGLYFDHSSNVKIRNCEIRDCFIVGDVSASGAGISCNASSPKIQDIIIRDCETEAPFTYGTAIYCHSNSNPEITRALIYNNDSEATDYARGGGIACVGSDPVLTNITITQSNMTGSNQYGGAIYADGADPVITNCIFYNNDNAEIYLEPDAFPVITYSDIDGGTGQPWFGTGCIDTDPLFLDPSPGVNDFRLSWDNFPIEDATKSPCIDTGDPSSPYDPDGSQADMGVYPFYQAYWLCGNTKGTLTQSGSPYIITCDVMILSTDSLFIEPGVEVIFMGNYKLEVHGQLFAEGTETDSIHFRPFDNSTGWHGIRFFDTETNTRPPSLLKYCDISGGLAFDDFSGGIDEWGGAILCYNSSDVEISNSTIHDNRAFGTGLGGGIYCYGSDIIIDSANIFNNYAGYAGGGIYLDDSDPVITRTIIAGNSASTTGAGIHIEENSSPEITNVTITENTGALSGGGIFIFNTTPTIKNSIIWNNENGTIGVMGTNSFSVTYSCVEGGWPGIGNVEGDPLFTNPSNYDFSLTWDNYPEPDETKSAAVDLGDPSSPSDPDGTRADMGAVYFEQTYTALPGGDISGTLYCADSPYFVFGDLTVPTGDELIIEPCVYIVFQGDYKLTVNGRLLAEGTEPDRITFYPADTITGWQGIRFVNQNTNGQDSSKLVHSRVLYGNADGYGGDAYGGGLYFGNSSDVLVKNCLITKNNASVNGGGIYCNENSHPVFINNIISFNTADAGGGIFAYSSHFILEGGFVENNTAKSGAGVYQYGGIPYYTGVTIRNNYATEFGGALYLNVNTSPIFNSTDRCNIYDNYAVIAGTDLCGKDMYPVFVMDVYVDTFTVMNIDDHFTYPVENFNLNHLNGKNPQYGVDLYVSPTGDDSNTGTSPSDPLKTIYRALLTIDPASVSPDSLTIRLESGTYSNTLTGEKFPLNWRSDVNLYGKGDPVSDSYLDGEDTTNFFYFYDDQNCILGVLEMQNGHAEYGGAMNLNYYSNPHFALVFIRNCMADKEGGGMYCYENSSPTFALSVFDHNIAGENGGGLACRTGSTPYLNCVNFDNNSALYAGGAIFTRNDCHFTMSHGRFNNNSANEGGACSINYNSDPVIRNVFFRDNQALSGNGGAIDIWYLSDLLLEYCYLGGNTASHGGGAIGFYQSVNLTLNNVRISGNSAAYGGGIYGHLWSGLTLRNVLLSGNYAEGSPYTDDDGGALFLWDVETELVNTTVSNNLAEGDGGAIFNKAGDISIVNSILWLDSPGEIYVESGSVTAEYSDIEGGWPGTGNINLDPDFYGVSLDYYSLNELSPCIDMGTPDTTGLLLPDYCLAGNPRIGNGRIDMGAYEYYERMELDLSVFLEGPFNGTNMNTNLISLTDFPITQPYNEPPWNYSGTESVTTIPGTGVVDWILIELRDAVDAASATGSTMFNRMTGFLLSDGSVVSTDGSSNLIFYNVLNEQLYAVIWHRNHLGVLSAYPLTESGGVYSYDFTSPVGQAYGTDAEKNLGGGIYGLYGGDGNADGTIDTDDKTTVWSVEAGTGGYLNSDFNMDSQTDNSDKNDIWINNTGNSSQIPD